MSAINGALLKSVAWPVYSAPKFWLNTRRMRLNRRPAPTATGRGRPAPAFDVVTASEAVELAQR
jgi:hypothetical protein